jgi:predicted HTH transcriptional regulator
MEAEVGISGSAIDNNIAFLKEIGLLSRQGAAKGGHWIIHFLKPEVGRKGG